MHPVGGGALINYGCAGRSDVRCDPATWHRMPQTPPQLLRPSGEATSSMFVNNPSIPALSACIAGWGPSADRASMTCLTPRAGARSVRPVSGTLWQHSQRCMLPIFDCPGLLGLPLPTRDTFCVCSAHKSSHRWRKWESTRTGSAFPHFARHFLTMFHMPGAIQQHVNGIELCCVVC